MNPGPPGSVDSASASERIFGGTGVAPAEGDPFDFNKFKNVSGWEETGPGGDPGNPMYYNIVMPLGIRFHP
jgi:hypothetical protein